MRAVPGRSPGPYSSQKEEPVQLWEGEAKIQRQSSPAKSRCGGAPAAAAGRQAEMATFEEQTACVVEALFSDLLGDDESDCRSLETDSGGRACVGGENGSFAADERSLLTEHSKEGGCSLGLLGFLKCGLVMTSKLSLGERLEPGEVV